jgi:aquaporin Z
VSGACFTLIYLIATPVTNASVNPARSTAAALFVGDWALDQLWLFWAAPMAGGLLAGLAYPLMGNGADNAINGRGTAAEPRDFR